MNQPQQQLNPSISGGNVNGPANIMNRPSSAYYNNNSNNNSNVMNLSSTPNIPNSTSNNTLQQQQAQATMMPFNAHISHPNLSGMTSNTHSPITTHRPPMIPNKQQQMPQQGFARDQSQQHSLRMNQQQMMAPSMPNIAHASGYANNIPASQSMQNVNSIPGNFQMYQQQQQQQQHEMPPQQISPNHHQASLLRGTAKMAEMSEMIKRQQTNQRPTNGPIHFANSMDNIHIPPPMLSPGASRSSAAQVFHPQSPQKSHAPPTTAPKPQVNFFCNLPRIRKSIFIYFLAY